MNALKNENIVLSKEASSSFSEAFIHLDLENLSLRDEYLDSLSSIQVTGKGDYFEVDIPGLDLEFLDDFSENEMQIEIQTNNVCKAYNYEYSLISMNVTLKDGLFVQPINVKMATDSSYEPNKETDVLLKCVKMNVQAA